MRVTHVIGGRPDPDSLNGVDKATFFITRAQARLGLDVGLFALDRAAPTPAEGVDARVFARRSWPFRAPAELLEALEAQRPDVVHLHSPYFPEHVPLSRWARRSGVPYVVTPHGALSPGELGHRWALKVPYKYMFERSILNGAAFVHALSPNEQLERYGVRAPIVIVPNGIEPLRAPAMKHRPLVERDPRLAGRMIFLYLGRLDPLQKGLDLLVTAVARTGLADIGLVIAGPDWRGRRRRLERAIAACPTSPPILLIDPLIGDDKLHALVEADVFVHISRWEGMSHAVLEAAALARPCLLTRVADPFDRLADAGAAVVVQTDAECVAEGIRHMRAMGRSALTEMGERARQVVLGEFTWQRTAEELTDAYRRYARAPA